MDAKPFKQALYERVGMKSATFDSWGVGLRAKHFQDWHAASSIPMLEIMADNLIHHEGGPALWHTTRIAERAAAVVLHGVAMNIGGANPLSLNYLAGIQKLIERFKPIVVSDHLCFSQAAGLQSYELLPLIRSRETLEHVIERVDFVQQFLGHQFTLENVSAYVSYKDDSIPEGDFLSEIAHRSGCGILLDVNNVFVTSKNFNLDPLDELKRFDLNAVNQIHVAGHSLKEDFLFDTHDSLVCTDVWDLLRKTLETFEVCNDRRVPVILENDNSEVILSDLLNELEAGKKFCLFGTPGTTSESSGRPSANGN